jgi:hypothetical protein
MVYRTLIRRGPPIGECFGERDVAQDAPIADVGSSQGPEASLEEHGQALPSQRMKRMDNTDGL